MDMMDFEAWRDRRMEVAREVSVARKVSAARAANGGGSFFEAFRNRVRRMVAALGYDGGRRVEEGSEGIVRHAPGGKKCRRGVVSRRARRKCVDTKAAVAKFEAQVRNQAALAGGDAAVETASRAMMASLEPAVRQLAWDLAEQAAVEVDAQLPDNEVEVTMREGEPFLKVREGEREAFFEMREEGDESRITLRLPANLKATIERAAKTAGDSVNSYLVKDIARAASKGGRGKAGKSFKGTVKS